MINLSSFSIDRDVPIDLFFPKGMLNPKEHKLLYLAGRDFLTKGGSLVDLGTFAGASSFCLVRGALDSSEFVTGQTYLHCYDKFTIDRNPNIIKFLTGAFLTSLHTSGKEVSSGVGIDALNNSFLPIFKFQCGQHLEHIKIHAGDILKATWEGDHIDAINVDIGKTKNIYAHVIKHFFPHVRKDGAIYHQDYYISAHYYLAMSMQLLSDYVEVLSDKVSSGVLYRLKKPFEADKLQEVIHTLENLTPRRIDELVSQIPTSRGGKRFADMCWAFALLDMKPNVETCDAIERRIEIANPSTNDLPLIQYLKNRIFTIRKHQQPVNE